MELHQFINLVLRKKKIIYGFITLFIVIAVIAVGFQRFKYSAKSQLLVVQERQDIVVDAYTASKSSEHLSRVLASVVNSSSFYTKVTTSSPSINAAYFGTTPREQMKQWDKTVSARSINDTGNIVITIFHPDRSEAEKIAGAVNYVLMTQHSAYDGGGESVKVRLIDQPVSSNFPVKPNLPLVFGLAFALGFVSSLIYIYLLADNTTKQNQFAQAESVSTPAFQDSYSVEQISRLTNYRPSPQPIYQERPAVTPYGHRSTVNLYNQFDAPIPEANFDPEVIVRQGNMNNILG